MPGTKTDTAPVSITFGNTLAADARTDTHIRPGQVVFVDAGVPDLDRLVAGAAEAVAVFRLDAAHDRVRQIADMLVANALHDLAAIHIVSHGRPGAVQLGSTWLDSGTIARHADLLARIGAALRPGGDILLYACDVAQGAAGRAFVAEFSALTDADVAAASHPVGAAARGGSWELDAGIGRGARNAPFTTEALAGYGGLLVAPATDLNGGGGGDDAAASFIEQIPVEIAPVATITDGDLTDLVSLTATLTPRPDGDAVESLALNGTAATAAAGAGLTVTYTPATGVLSVTGPAAPIATYTTILQGIQYNNTSDTPTMIDRFVDIVVNDGTDPSAVNTVTISVNAVNDPPVTDLNGGTAGDDATAAFTEQTPVEITPDATIADADSGTLTSLTATLTPRPDGDAAESLSLNATAATAAAGAGLTVTYTAATGVLSVTGPAASLATYEAILQGLQYNNTDDDPTTTDRNVDIVVHDGTDPSVVNSVTITVAATNDPPATDLNGGVAGDDATASFSEQTPVEIAPAGTITDVDFDHPGVADRDADGAARRGRGRVARAQWRRRGRGGRRRPDRAVHARDRRPLGDRAGGVARHLHDDPAGHPVQQHQRHADHDRPQRRYRGQRRHRSERRQQRHHRGDRAERRAGVHRQRRRHRVRRRADRGPDRGRRRGERRRQRQLRRRLAAGPNHRRVDRGRYADYRQCRRDHVRFRHRRGELQCGPDRHRHGHPHQPPGDLQPQRRRRGGDRAHPGVPLQQQHRRSDRRHPHRDVHPGGRRRERGRQSGHGELHSRCRRHAGERRADAHRQPGQPGFHRRRGPGQPGGPGGGVHRRERRHRGGGPDHHQPDLRGRRPARRRQRTHRGRRHHDHARRQFLGPHRRQRPELQRHAVRERVQPGRDRRAHPRDRRIGSRHQRHRQWHHVPGHERRRPHGGRAHLHADADRR